MLAEKLKTKTHLQPKRWNYNTKFESKEFGSLDSAESVEIYLKRCGYGTVTGLPFPFDEPPSPLNGSRRLPKQKNPELLTVLQMRDDFLKQKVTYDVTFADKNRFQCDITKLIFLSV